MKIFYINLDERLDRRHFQESQLSKLGLESERICAVKIDNPIVFEHINDNQLTTLRPGEIACTLSHIKSWNEILNQNLKHAVVLEDDAVLSKNFKTAIKKIEESNLQFDLIRIELRYGKPVYISKPYLEIDASSHYKLCKCFESMSGSAGYIISSSLIKKIINSKILFSRPIDLCFFGDNSIFFNKYRCFHIIPALVTQSDQLDDVNFTEISKTSITLREDAKNKKESKLIHELIRPFNQLINLWKITLKILLIVLIRRDISTNLLLGIFSPLIKYKNRTRKLLTINKSKEWITFH